MFKTIRASLVAFTVAFASVFASSAMAQEQAPAPSGRTMDVFLGAGSNFKGNVELKDDFGFFDEGGDKLRLNTGYQVFGGVGVNHVLLRNVRIEAEGVFDSNKLSDEPSVRVRTYAGLVNAIYQFKINKHLTVFGGGGLGYGRTNLRDDFFISEARKTAGQTRNLAAATSDKISGGGLAWDMKAGVALAVGRKSSIDVGYRYLNGPNVDVGFTDFEGPILTGKFDKKTHAMTLSYRRSFGRV